MEKRTAIVLFFMMVSNNLLSQEIEESCKINVTYSKTKRIYEVKMDENKQCKNSDKFRFIIENPYPYKYDLKILSAKTLNYKIGVPSALGAYFGLVKLDDQPVPPGPIIKLLDEPEEIQDSTKNLISSIKKLEEKISQEFDPYGLEANGDNKSMEFDIQIWELRKALREAELQFKQQRQNLSYFQHLLESYNRIKPQIERYNAIYKNMKKLNTIISTLTKKLQTAKEVEKDSIYSISKNECLKIYKLKDKTIIELKDTVEIELIALEALNETIEEVLNSGYDLNDELLESIYSVNMAHRYIQEKIDIKSQLALMERFEKPKAEVETEDLFYSGNADATRLQLALFNKLSPKDTLFTQKIDIPICRGIDIGFSTGFVYNSLYQREFYLDDEIISDGITNLDTTKVIGEQDKFKGDVAFSAFVDISLRRCKARYGLSGGIGIGITDGNPRYLIGGHVLFLAKQSLGINTGLVWGKVKTLSTTVSRNGSEPTNPVSRSLSSVPTYERMDLGYYVGIVWNFARK